MTTYRKWTTQEEAALIDMTIQGRGLDFIRTNLPRPEGADIRTRNAIKSRIGEIYSLGLINTVEGDGPKLKSTFLSPRVTNSMNNMNSRRNRQNLAFGYHPNRII